MNTTAPGIRFQCATTALPLAEQCPFTEQQGVIQVFEFNPEIAWNVMKDFFWQGITAINGSQEASREAFSRDLIEDGEGWMEMIRSRNQTSNTYNQEVAEQIIELIITRYYPIFTAFEVRMQHIRDTP